MAGDTFTLQYISPETDCSVHELRFRADPHLVTKALVIDTAALATQIVYLDAEDLGALSKVTGLSLPEWAGEVILRRPHRIDETPYLVHTNFELPLMLDGRKPLAIHSGERGFDPFETGRSCFRPHVENGRIIERITSVQGGGRSFLTVYYALPGQEWRFDAYEELMNGPRPWTEAMERRLGMLLGYTDEECDWWIANGFRHTSPIATS